MRNCTIRFLRRTTLLMGVLLMLVCRLAAQTDIKIGTDTTGNTNTGYPCPLQDYFEGSRAQYLFRASELRAAGMNTGAITAIKFLVKRLNGGGIIEQYTLKIGTTTDATLSDNSWVAGSNTVLGPVDYQPVIGLNTFTFSTPFFWNGTDNIVVEVCNGAPDSDNNLTYTYNPEVTFTQNLSFNGSHTYRADNLNYACGTTSTTNNGTMTSRPNLIFSWAAASACTGTPVAGTATANPTTVCMGQTFNVSLTGSTLASGLEYQWQISTNNTTWTDIPNQTSAKLTATQTATSYYRCKVTCKNGNTFAFSNSVVVNSPLAVSGTFSINKAQPTGGTNFASFGDAYNYMKCGINGPVIFNVVAGSGPYVEQLILKPVPGASATNTITFNGNGDTLTYAPTSANKAIIKLDDADYFTFNNLVIKSRATGSGTYGWGVFLTNDADNNTISNSTFVLDTTTSSTDHAGIVISSSASSATTTGDAKCDFNTFTGNTIVGGYYGIVMTGSSSMANGNNKITNNKILEFYSYGIHLQGSFNTLIENNIISRPQRSYVSSFYGIYFTGLSTRANVTRNRISNPFGGAGGSTSSSYGIYFSGTDALSQLENKVTNNLIYNFTGKGDVYGIYNSSSDNVWYYHNTVAVDGSGSATGSYAARGFYQTSKAEGLEFLFNLITVSRTGAGNKHAVYFGTNTSVIHANRNDYFVTPAATSYTGYAGGNAVTLLDWQTASKQDTNGLAVNPLFASTGSGNYQPTNASLDNKALPGYGITVDLNNTTRNATTPDIGAIEFTPGPCTTPPTPGNAKVNPATVCVNRKVTLTLADNSIGLGQTYQWQTAATISGPYTSLGTPMTNPDTVVQATATLYYRVAVTCSGNTAYSTPALLTVSPAFPGGTYTINKGAPGSATNFVSFNAAKAAMECGISGPVIFNVVSGSGPYAEQLILDSIAGTSAVNTITFNGNGNTIKFQPSDNQERAVIKLRGADYITFDSLTIDATGGDYGYGVHLLANADSNTISRNKILTDPTEEYGDYAGVVINGADGSTTSGTNNRCDGNVVRNNNINGGIYGIVIYGESATPVIGNKIVGNTIREFYESGIQATYTIYTLIDKNTMSRPTRVSESYTLYGIQVEDKGEGVVVSNNRVHHMFDGNPTTSSSFIGISFSLADATSTNPAKVFNNVVTDIRGEGTQSGLQAYSADYVHFYHNTIVLDDQLNTSQYDESMALNIGSSGAGMRVFNNIFDVRRSGGGARVGIELPYGGITGLSSDYNDIYLNSTTGETFFGRSNIDYPTHADWKAGIKADSNSLTIAPVYADPSAGNYAPVISPLDNSGKAGTGVTIDIAGVTRSTTTPDMGAWEINIPQCTKPIIPGTAVVDPVTAICMGTKIKLDLTGNSKGGFQTYQWQRATSATGPWENASDTLYVSVFNTEIGVANYYRCRIVCAGTDTAYSALVKVNLNPPLLAGTYTINPALPVSATNFQSFSSVISKLECGIAGPVLFLAKAGTYNEQLVMHHIPGSSRINTVTFQSETNTASSVTLSNTATSAANYVLSLDSVKYVSWRAITFKPLSTRYARGVVFNNKAAFDSIVNCTITLPVSTSGSNSITGVFADAFEGDSNVIRGNTIVNGSYGISWKGDYNVATPSLVIDSNTISQSNARAIDLDYVGRAKIRKNIITQNAPGASGATGIYVYNSDSSFVINDNKVNISNATLKVMGIYVGSSKALTGERARVSGNQIIARTGLTSTVYGMELDDVAQATVVNNIISVKTSATSAYGLYSTSGTNIDYYNNSVLNSTVSATGENYAGAFNHSGTYANNIKIKNNIFANDTTGRALYIADPAYLKSDYNTLYTKGSVLVQRGGWPGAAYANLEAYKNAAGLDISSIVYKPAFVDDNELKPDVNNPHVWAIHGRGVQVPENDKDILGNNRPTTLTAGVPDMGAYEFLPAVTPPALPAIPAVAAPGVTQAFMFGSDTVTKITWIPGADIPTDFAVRRYSGVKPPNIATGTDYMYFYTDVDVTPSGSRYNYNIQQFYVDSWQGFIKRQKDIRLARTDSTNTWKVDSLSTVNDSKNIITDSTLHYFDKFTGLNGSEKTVQVIQPADSSNRGTRFWVGYGYHQFFEQSNDQNMVLYLNAEDSSNVTVRINGTAWERTYRIPANKTITTEIIPKSGLNDARLVEEGLSDKGISIESDVPIVAYAHIYGSASSGATMLLPVGTYGYDYSTLSSRQNYATTGTYSWFYVIADYDNTKVEITPSVPTLAGKPANQTFTVTLNKGDVYQVLGAMMGSSSEGYDLSGSRVKSIQNEDGKCYPMAVFSGSSRTGLACGGAAGGSGDNFIQQNFPSQAWGKKYLTAPTSNSSSATSLMTNIYRVLVKDVATVVKRNGVALTGIINNRFYQYESGTADYIEADQPVMVAQYMSSSGSCPNTGGDGDPEMIYISPLEQGIKKVGLYRNTVESITRNYLTLIIPTGGVPSLRIDGSPTVDYTYPHPNLAGYTVVVKRWAAAAAQCSVVSDSAFTAITYGLGSVESYGYNAGTLVKNLNILPSFNNVWNNTGNKNTYTCAKTPFQFSMLIPVKPTSITWKLSQVSNLTPNADVVQQNPVPADSLIANERKYYRFVLPQQYVFSKPGKYFVPILLTHPDIESCSNSFESILEIKVIPAPVVNFNVDYTGCVNDVATFKGLATTSNGVGISSWKWDFADTTYGYAKDTVKRFKYPGTRQVKLSIVAAEGCIGDTTKEVEVFSPAVAFLVKDSMTVCSGTDVTLAVKDPEAGVLYNWYDAPVAGNLLHTGNTYTITAIAASGTYYLETVTHGCPGEVRRKAIVHVLPVLATPVAKVDSVGVNTIRFKWNAIVNATGYEVSLDGGTTWKVPSSGSNGLVHVVIGLKPVQSITLIVRAKGCEDKVSEPVEGKTLPDGVYIPNAFTPNNDGKNDILLVYGYIIKDLHLAIFDQWGEKVFETNSQTIGWDGTYKGKELPSGVYIYVGHFTLTDGSKTEKKGVVNLIR
ncbi:right-handed parallel beta-helix repeat-containing protein [Chitinophaga nivalis]|uniref:Right-handed parallel beta-helix repeat-containing protein n=1 Tax=Chitinophaga nivalis TaxID=2991709 RepID=A0ABT3IFG9_9BACT|nr:right-handed parallel beta-helix repeat-containing protein [Chitinophaga nivalis]MCW3467601.1 right-handed parallel beta-helix repeat-containing protein [Chitinophaga nivalis]MCW3482707.1 right-handed parallel beta-helix repeat-containing protein [Chitinophaga nivalis]